MQKSRIVDNCLVGALRAEEEEYLLIRASTDSAREKKWTAKMTLRCLDPLSTFNAMQITISRDHVSSTNREHLYAWKYLFEKNREKREAHMEMCIYLNYYVTIVQPSVFPSCTYNRTYTLYTSCNDDNNDNSNNSAAQQQLQNICMMNDWVNECSKI